MKNNYIRTSIISASLLLLTQAAQAFYHPSTGRWLSWDPAEDLLNRKRVSLTHSEGAATRPVPPPARMNERRLIAPGRDASSYAFLDNSAVGSIDFLGLFSVDYPAPSPRFKTWHDRGCTCFCKTHASFLVCFPSKDGTGLPDCHNYTEDNLPYKADGVVMASGLQVDEAQYALIWPYWEVGAVPGPNGQPVVIRCTKKCNCDCLYLGRGSAPGICLCGTGI
jgi:hypothetical protein